MPSKRGPGYCEERRRGQPEGGCKPERRECRATSQVQPPEHDGSLSGARLKEAISWGKMRPEAPNVCVEGDASVLLPLIGYDLFGGN